MVDDDLVEPSPQVGEPVLVGGEHLVDARGSGTLSNDSR